jgi:hypothetical protein
MKGLTWLEWTISIGILTILILIGFGMNHEFTQSAKCDALGGTYLETKCYMSLDEIDLGD